MKDIANDNGDQNESPIQTNGLGFVEAVLAEAHKVVARHFVRVNAQNAVVLVVRGARGTGVFVEP